MERSNFKHAQFSRRMSNTFCVVHMYSVFVFTYTQHRQKTRFMLISMCWEREKKIENCFEHVRVFLTVYEPLRAVTVAHSHYSVPILWRDIVLFQCCTTSETLKKKIIKKENYNKSRKYRIYTVMWLSHLTILLIAFIIKVMKICLIQS